MFGILVVTGCTSAALGRSWDERVFNSHLDFNSIAAAGPSALPGLIERGRELFRAKFTTEDGAGRPKATQAIVPTKRKSGVNPAFTRTSGPDSNSCAGCHNDPIVGGSGDFVSDAFVSEGFESAQFNSTDPSFSSERHTIAADGRRPRRIARARDDGRLATRARRRRWQQARTKRQERDSRPHVQRRALWFDPPRRADEIVDLSGVEGIDADLILRPFSRKGVFTSLRQFTINAMNIHHGMEAVERFGVSWTGTHDFGESGVPTP